MPEIVTTEGVLGGDPRIEGTRIGVHHVYERYVEADESPKSIASSLDISVADVHAALASAFTTPERMREIEARKQDLLGSPSSQRFTPEDVR